MKLKTFLLQRNRHQLIEEPVIFFYAKEYPILFISQLIKKLKVYEGINFKSIPAYDTDWQQLQAILSTTFLGQKELIWLGDLSQCDASKRKKITSYLEEYYGPHTVLCYSAEKDLPKSVEKETCKLDEPLQKTDIEVIASYLYDASSDTFFSMVKTHYKSLSLDTVALLLQYSLVLGSGTQAFMRDWYQQVVRPEESLFALAQCFFARKQDLFFRTWLAVKDQYVPVFWTTFWSEQIWRAYHVIAFRQKEQFNQAKQISFRLPFSFLQKDWRTIKITELQQAHDFLYQADRKLKRGCSDLVLDLFYTNFLQKKF